LINTLVENTLFPAFKSEGYKAEVMHTVNFIVIDHLISLAGDPGSYPQVRAIVNHQLAEIKARLENTESSGSSEVYRLAYIEQISENRVKHLDHLPRLPPGAPIGMECMDH